jgi:hypothetical protein
VAAHAGDFTGFVGMGLTGGGDTLVHVTYTNGDTHDIKAGGLIDFRGGFEYRQKGSPFAIQGSIGYHFDRASASNGSVRFERFPVELLGFWYATPNVRLGGGVRYATSPEVRSSGVASSSVGNASLSADPGAVLEGEYLFGDHFGVTLRAVTEKYKVGGVKIDGDHIGVRFNYYF